MGLKYVQPLFPFLLGMALILASQTFFAVGLVNSVLQTVLFALVVCIPIWRTGRISYVDIGWPWGLVVLAAVSYLFSDGHWLRSLVVTLAVAVIGLRMGLGAVSMWRRGILNKEFPAISINAFDGRMTAKTISRWPLKLRALPKALQTRRFSPYRFSLSARITRQSSFHSSWLDCLSGLPR